MQLRIASLQLLVALLLILASARAEDDVRSPWLPVQSDLGADPLLVDRVLPNGVRYLILPNAEPKDHVSLRLVVGAGSLHENDDELGLAHFVEHMAFRATRDYPNGKMAETLQRLGIAFGPDSTAFTSYDHTIYHLEVPTTQPSTVRVALHAFREYADGVTFDPELIDRERGVVLSEMATRDTPAARATLFNLAFLWPRSREVQRNVIGSAAMIRRFTRPQFVAFYDAWYRPERLAVIVVGHVDVPQMESMIQAEFGSLAARAPARVTPNLVTAEAAPPDIAVFRDPGMIGLSLGLERVRRSPRLPDTHAQRVRQLHRALAFTMFQLRLRKLADQENGPFSGPIASVGPGLRGWDVASVSVNGRLDQWRTLATELELEHRRAVQFGFTAAELAEARAAFLMQLEEAARSAATRPSAGLAQQLLDTLLNGSRFATPASFQRDLAPEVSRAELKECLEEFRAAWLPGAASVLALAPDTFQVKPNDIAAVVNHSRETPVTRPVDAAVKEFAYDQFGPPGRLAREEHLPDLDVRLSEFENGVKLNFKRTGFEADVVEVRVRVGDGKLSQLKSRPGLDILADTAFCAGGVGRHSRQELNDILAGHALQLSFQVASDAFVFYGRCAPRELDLMLRIIAAFMTDPSFRPESMRQARADFGSLAAGLLASAGGPITMFSTREMFGDDGRFGVATYDEFSARDLGELRAWIEPQLQHGPVEVSLVGDVAWPDASAAVANSLGTLAPREPVQDHSAPLPVSVNAVPSTVKIYPISPTMKQVAIAWYWMVPLVKDIHEERRCYLLAAVLADRLRIKLREELGATYAPMVMFNHSDGFPNLNFFAFYAEIAPGRAQQALDIVARETLAMSRKGPTADEFERAKQPYVRSMTNDLRTNAYWGGTVLSDAQQRPSRLAAARDRSKDIEAISRAEITDLARRYLAPSRAFKFAAVPAAAAK